MSNSAPYIVGTIYTIGELVYSNLRVVNFEPGKHSDQFTIEGLSFVLFRGSGGCATYYDGHNLEVPVCVSKTLSSVHREADTKAAEEASNRLIRAVEKYNAASGAVTKGAVLMVGVTFDDSEKA